MVACQLVSLSLLQAILRASSAKFRREHKTKASLAHAFTKHTRVHYHQNEPAIKPSISEFKPKLCLTLGVCVCGEGPQSSPDAFLFWQKVRQLLQGNLAKPRKQAKPAARLAAERHSVIMGFQASPGWTESQHTEAGDPQETLYFHLGYMNFSSWHFGGCQMYAVDSGDPILQTVLRSDVLQLRVLQPADAGPSCSVFSDVQWFAARINFEQAWKITFYQVCLDEDCWQRADTSSSIVPVCSLEPAIGGIVWHGSAYEASMREKKARKRTAKSELTLGSSNQPAPKRRKRGKQSDLQGPEDAAVSMGPVQPDGSAADPLRPLPAMAHPGEESAGPLSRNLNLDMFAAYDCRDDDEEAAKVGDADKNESNSEIGARSQESGVASAASLDPLDLLHESDFEAEEPDGREVADDFGAFLGESGKVSDEPSDSVANAAGPARVAEAASGSRREGEGPDRASAPADSAPGGPDADDANAANAGREYHGRELAGRDASLFLSDEFVVPGFGVLRHYSKRAILQAKCNNPAHGDCRLARSLASHPSANSRNRNRTKTGGQGRPGGVLTCWLTQCFEHSSRYERTHS